MTSNQTPLFRYKLFVKKMTEYLLQTTYIAPPIEVETRAITKRAITAAGLRMQFLGQRLSVSAILFRDKVASTRSSSISTRSSVQGWQLQRLRRLVAGLHLIKEKAPQFKLCES